MAIDPAADHEDDEPAAEDAPPSADERDLEDVIDPRD
jgi:hypothetical protein